MIALAVFTAAALAQPTILPAQAPASPQEGVVASWDGGRMSMQSFEHFLGKSFKNKELGNDALRHILQIQLVEREASRRSLKVPPEMLEERLEAARNAAEGEGYDLKILVESRGLSMAEFERLLGNSVLHDMMARQDLGIARGVELSNEQLQAWSDSRLQDLLKRAAVAPEGYAIDAAPYVVTIQELGEVIEDILTPSRKLEYLEQLVLETYMPKWADEQGLVLTDDVLEAEIDWRRKRTAEHPAYGGAPYEELLKSQGSSLELVRQGSELRLAGYLRLYSRVAYDDSWFEALDERTRAQLEAEYGVRRHCSWVMIRAVEEKKTEIDLDYDGAAKELDAHATRMVTAADFAAVAGKYSEHEGSRRRDGELGWIPRVGGGSIDPALAKAAFEAPIGAAYGPFRVSGGMALVWVHDETAPDDELGFRAAVRRGRHIELRQRVLEQIKLNTIYKNQAPTPPKGASPAQGD